MAGQAARETAHKLVRLGVLASLGLALSGCIAAAAIPVLAGGGVLGSRLAERDSDQSESAAIPRPPFEQVTGRPVVATETARLAEAAQTPAPRSELPATYNAKPTLPPGPVAPVELTLPDGSRVAIDGAAATGIEAQSLAALSPLSAPRDKGVYEELYSYVANRAGPGKIGEKRYSALLDDPGTLKPVTTPCILSQPAILIDLDPGAVPADTTATYAPNPQFAQVLARLRDDGVSIQWLSGNSAGEAGAIRRLLTQTGLDPESRDELVLMRYPDDRKQTRRYAVGATHCLLAIAGEDRRDFDELYAYLKNPDGAFALQPLYGRGWFVIPPALQPMDR